MMGKILGFTPIREPGPGTITTQAFINCADCGKAVSGHGGPRRDALCLDCAAAFLQGRDSDGCRNCGATEKPDLCSGGPWCKFPRGLKP